MFWCCNISVLMASKVINVIFLQFENNKRKQTENGNIVLLARTMQSTLDQSFVNKLAKNKYYLVNGQVLFVSFVFVERKKKLSLTDL